MKHRISWMVATTLVAMLGISTLPVIAANSPTTAQSALQLSYGVADVLKLAQAKLGDEVIVSYIQNTGLSYANLSAAEIIYLHEQGVSTRVVTTMLAQRKTLSDAAIQAPPQPTQVSASAAIATPPASLIAPIQSPAPAVIYTQPAPTVIVMRDSSPRLVDYGIYPSYGYYPSYNYYSYPRASFSFGFGSGFCGGFRGGYQHSSYRGGGFHSYGGHHR